MVLYTIVNPLSSKTFIGFGNRNRQGDPPVLADRLLCISLERWEEVLDAVEGAGLGGGGGIPVESNVEDFIDEKSDELEDLGKCLEISESRHPWWERENWKDVWDEELGWADLSRNAQRELLKLKGR